MRIESYKTEINCERLKTMPVTFRRNTKSRQIYHYTSIGGIEGILSEGKLRFTNIKYLNDKDETVAGVDSLISLCGAKTESDKKIISDIFDYSAQNFVCCFSLDQDSLPMWNYYTKEANNQGYNIEFDDKELVKSLLFQNSCLDGCDIAFGIVDYSEEDYSRYSVVTFENAKSSASLSMLKLSLEMLKMAKNKFDIDEDIIKREEKKIKEAEKKTKLKTLPIYGFDGIKCSFSSLPLLSYCCFIKRDCFKQEREFRIVISVPADKLGKLKKYGVYKFRISNGALIPYLELKFSVGVIKSITISPTVQSDLVEQSIKDFTTYCGLQIDDYTKFIKKSNVPVRF
jgi:hypothetical protein